jgi:hypothetical protein
MTILFLDTFATKLYHPPQTMWDKPDNVPSRESGPPVFKKRGCSRIPGRFPRWAYRGFELIGVILSYFELVGVNMRSRATPPAVIRHFSTPIRHSFRSATASAPKPRRRCIPVAPVGVSPAPSGFQSFHLTHSCQDFSTAARPPANYFNAKSQGRKAAREEQRPLNFMCRIFAPLRLGVFALNSFWLRLAGGLCAPCASLPL